MNHSAFRIFSRVPKGLFFSLLSLIFLAGCVSTSDKSTDELAAQEQALKKALSDLAEAPYGPAKLVSEFPRLEARFKVSNQRVESKPIVQTDGRSFPSRFGPSIGFPAALELKNTDSVVVEITDLEIWRRTPRLVGDYEPLLGNDPIVLQSGDVWRGTFIVSRKSGWFRLESQAAAPEGWLAIQGEGTRNVYFREETTPSLGYTSYNVEITFWNLREDDVSFRYWVTTEEVKGYPESAEGEGVVNLKPGEAAKVEVTTEKGKWVLVTAPVEEEGKDG